MGFFFVCFMALLFRLSGVHQTRANIKRAKRGKYLQQPLGSEEPGCWGTGSKAQRQKLKTLFHLLGCQHFSLRAPADHSEIKKVTTKLWFDTQSRQSSGWEIRATSEFWCFSALGHMQFRQMNISESREDFVPYSKNLNNVLQVLDTGIFFFGLIWPLSFQAEDFCDALIQFAIALVPIPNPWQNSPDRRSYREKQRAKWILLFQTCRISWCHYNLCGWQITEQAIAKS